MPSETFEQLALLAANYRDRGWTLKWWSLPSHWLGDLLEEGGLTYNEKQSAPQLAGLPVYTQLDDDAVLYGCKPDGLGECGISAKTGEVI